MTNWDNITVEQFMEIKGVEKDSLMSSTDRDLHIISIVEQVDIQELEDRDYSELKAKCKEYEFLSFEPPRKFVKSVDRYRYIGFKNLVLAEYIDLTYYFQDLSEHLTTILAIVFREGFEYDYDPRDYAEDFEELPISSVYGVITEFVAFKDEFEKVYENLFEPEFNEEDYDEEDKKEMQEDKIKNRWSWEFLVDKLANHDITKHSEVLNLPLYQVFNTLSMRKDLGVGND